MNSNSPILMRRRKSTKRRTSAKKRTSAKRRTAKRRTSAKRRTAKRRTSAKKNSGSYIHTHSESRKRKFKQLKNKLVARVTEGLGYAAGGAVALAGIKQAIFNLKQSPEVSENLKTAEEAGEKILKKLKELFNKGGDKNAIELLETNYANAIKHISELETILKANKIKIPKFGNEKTDKLNKSVDDSLNETFAEELDVTMPLSSRKQNTSHIIPTSPIDNTSGNNRTRTDFIFDTSDLT